VLDFASVYRVGMGKHDVKESLMGHRFRLPGHGMVATGLRCVRGARQTKLPLLLLLGPAQSACIAKGLRTAGSLSPFWRVEGS